MRKFLLLVCLLGLFVYQNLALAKPPKIVLATDDWEPYVFESKPGHGKFCEIVSAVFKEMGMEVEYVFAPWKRVEAIVRSGEAYAGIPYTYTEERAKIFDYSLPIMNSSNVFFYHKKNFPNGIKYSRLEDLKVYRISGVTGYWYELMFAKAGLNVEYVTTDEQGIAKLYFNRVDVAASDELVGWALIKKMYPQEASQFATLSPPFATHYLHLLVSKNYPNAAELTQKFNATYKKLYGQ